VEEKEPLLKKIALLLKNIAVLSALQLCYNLRMTKIYKSPYRAKISSLEENPLPIFRDKEHDISVITQENVPERYTHNLGLDCGRRILPYTFQDRYNRNLKETEEEAIILENDYLKATFLPTLGGRLISLYDKKEERELLFANKSLQFANLSNRNAWFAGGIEWNIGQYGHSYLTCSPVCFTKQETKGDPFLRMLIYESCKKVCFQLDFHLPSNSKLLHVYMKVCNPFKEKTTLYYWTNTAVEQKEKTRVFASSDHAFYLNPKPTLGKREYGYMEVPDLPLMKGVDASYPANFTRCSLEYFFTCDQDKIPWEASLDEDGKGFFEASTQPLSYRKMFCWGTHEGGRKWQEFLAPGEGKSYLEIQAGLAPSQLHGLYLGSGESQEHLQLFGSLIASSTCQDKDYKKAKAEVKERVEKRLEAINFESLLNTYREQSTLKGEEITTAENRAPLETKLAGVELPPLFDFGKPCKEWETYLEKRTFSAHESYTLPFVTGKEWIALLEKPAAKDAEAERNYYLALAYEEEERLAEAEECFKRAARIKPGAIVLRNLASIKKKQDDLMGELYYYSKARELGLNLFMEEEYFDLLYRAGKDNEALAFFNTLTTLTDTILITRALLSLRLKDFAWLKENFFTRELANIREGNTILSDIWEEYHRLQNLEIPPIPDNLNFKQLDL